MVPARRFDAGRAGRLAALVAGVLAAHLALLAWHAPEATPPTPAARALITRQLNLPRPTEAEATPTPTSPRPRVARPRNTTPVAAALPAPEPHPAPPPEPAPVVEPATPAPLAQASPPEPTAPPAPVLATVHLPPATTLAYDVQVSFRGIPNSASGTLTWETDGHSYRMQMEIRALLGSRQQTSEGQVGPGGLAPRRFAERTRSERAAHFEPEAGRIRFSANTPDAPWRAGAQDRLSLFLQLAGQLNARAAAPAPGTELSTYTAGVREAEDWVFVVRGSETLELPGGPLPALHLQRLPRREHDQTVDLWLAPSLGHLPARIRLQDSRGDVADQRLRAW